MISRLTLKCLGLLTSFSFGALLPGSGNPQSLCVQLTNGKGGEQSVPVNLGSAMRLRFLHSIYGSQVEELFALQHDGFQLTQLRYSEARLVDFYGYENAKYHNGVWIVSPPPTLLRSLNLTTSADTAMFLRFDEHTDSKPLMIRATGVLRLTVASCPSSAHG